MPAIQEALRVKHLNLNITKATTDEQGRLHVIGVASDTQEDFHGERFTLRALEQMRDGINAGGIIILPTHWDTFEIGSAYKAWLDEESETLWVDMLLDDEYPQARKLWQEVNSGNATKQMSVGGYVKFETYGENADYWWEGDVMVLNNMCMDHIAITRGGHAANDRTMFSDASIKRLEQHGVIKGMIPQDAAIYHKAALDTGWEFSQDDQDAVLKKGGWELFKSAHTWWNDKEGVLPENKSAYALPHHKIENNEFSVVLRGVLTQMAVVLLNRMGDEIPDEDRRKAYSHLANHYNDFGYEAPQYKTYTPHELVESHKNIFKSHDQVQQIVKDIQGVIDMAKKNKKAAPPEDPKVKNETQEEPETEETAKTEGDAPEEEQKPQNDTVSTEETPAETQEEPAAKSDGDDSEESAAEEQPAEEQPAEEPAAEPETAESEKTGGEKPDALKSFIGRIKSKIKAKQEEHRSNRDKAQKIDALNKAVDEVICGMDHEYMESEGGRVGDAMVMMMLMMLESQLEQIDLEAIPSNARSLIFGMGYLAGSMGDDYMMQHLMGMLKGGDMEEKSTTPAPESSTKSTETAPNDPVASDETQAGNLGGALKSLQLLDTEGMSAETKKSISDAINGIKEHCKGTHKSGDGQEPSPSERGQAQKSNLGSFLKLR